MLVLLASLSAGTEVGAIVRPEAIVDLAADRAHEDTVEVRTRVRAFARDELEHDARWFLEVWGEHEVLVGQSVLLPTGPNDDDVEGAWGVSLGECGWQGRLGSSADLRVGTLIERWGKLDLLPVVDVVNPRDLRTGPLVPQEWQRIPIPMAAFGVGREPVRGELLLIPFATGDRVSMNGTDWSLVRQEMIEDQLAEMATWSGTNDTADAQFQSLMANLSRSLDELDPSFRRGLDQAAAGQELPQALGISGDAAARVELAISRLDAALMVGALRSRQKAVSLKPAMAEILESEDAPTASALPDLQSGAIVTATWPRTYVAGLEASTLVGPIGIRGEGLFQSAVVTPRAWMQSDVSPLVGAGLGVDWSYGTKVYLVGEASYRHLLDPPGDLLFTTPDALQLGAGMRFNLAADRVEIQVGGAYHVQLAEHLVRPTVAWRVSDRVELEGGALILGGPSTPPTMLRGALAYDGGLLGYFGQNDAATLAVSFIL